MPSVRPAQFPDESATLTPVRLPVWLRRIGLAGIACAFLALLLLLALEWRLIGGAATFAAILFLALLSVVSGTAILFSRLGRGEVTSREALPTAFAGFVESSAVLIGFQN